MGGGSGGRGGGGGGGGGCGDVGGLSGIFQNDIVRFSCFLKGRSRPMDRWTYGPTDLWTDPLIEMRGRI